MVKGGEVIVKRAEKLPVNRTVLQAFHDIIPILDQLKTMDTLPISGAC